MYHSSILWNSTFEGNLAIALKRKEERGKREKKRQTERECGAGREIGSKKKM